MNCNLSMLAIISEVKGDYSSRVPKGHVKVPATEMGIRSWIWYQQAGQKARELL